MRRAQSTQVRQAGARSSSTPDLRLIARALSRPARARGSLELLLQRHRPWIVRRCEGWVGNRADAEDVAQEVLVRVCAGLHGLEHRSRFRPWLARIVDNQCKTHLVRRRRWVTVEHLEQLLDVLAVEAPSLERDHAAREHVQRALGELPAQAQQVLYLRFYRELSLEQIAGSLGISLAAAKMRLYRALDRFDARFHALEI